MRRPNADDVQWWEPAKRNRHELVVGVVNEIQTQGSYRRSQNLHHLRMYSDRAVTGAIGGSYSGYVEDRGFRRPRLSINVVRNCIDSATSLITRGRPAVSYITSEGDYTRQQRAKARSKFVQAIFHQNSVYDTGPKIFKDSCIFGTGIAKVCRDYDRVLIEKVFPGEIWVDDAEAVYGDPPSLFQVKAVDKRRLKARFPGKANIIDTASPPDIKNYGRSAIANQVQVIEAWHLPSGPEAGDGRHVICLDSGVLRDEGYEHQNFPFAVMRWNDDPIGWWGTGLAYELAGLQYEINSLLRMAQLGMYSAGGAKVLVEKGSKIAKTHLNNDLWATVVEYVGAAPQWIVPPPMSPVVQAMLQFYIDQSYAITGISQLGARGEIPSGLAGSGRAQLVYKDIESQRFITVQRRYEQFFMDLAECSLQAAADMAEQEGGEFEATYVGGKLLERVHYSDIGDEDDEFCVQAEPVSMLPYTMAGKFALAEQMRAAGYIDANSAKKLSGLPDVDAEMNLELAPIDLVDDAIERILEKGESLWPDPRGDVGLAVKRASLAFQRAQLSNAPPDRLDLLAEYIDAGNDMLQITETVNAQAAMAATPAVPAASWRKARRLSFPAPFCFGQVTCVSFISSISLPSHVCCPHTTICLQKYTRCIG